MHDIRYDAVNDEILLTSPFSRAILVFRGGADGEEAPIRVIQGPHVTVGDRLDVDSVHDEIFIPAGNKVLVYPRTGNGDVAPIRVIQGPDTQVKDVRALAVDPVHNLIIVSDRGTGSSGGRSGAAAQPERSGLLLFNRTDQGNIKPRAVVRGPKTGMGTKTTEQLLVYPPRGWIVMPVAIDYVEPEPEGIFVGVWSIHDNGDVPPRWMIGGPKSTLKKPRGVALDPKNKELIVADMTRNAVLIYYFPEIF